MKAQKTKSWALPATLEELTSHVGKLASLSEVASITITPDAITLVRSVLPDEEIAPDPVSPAEVGANFLLKQISLEALRYVEDEYPYFRLLWAFEELRKRNLVPVCVIAPEPLLFWAFLGLEEPLPLLFSVPVIYAEPTDPDAVIVGPDSDKLVVVGGVTTNAAQATFGVVVDMGD